MPSREEMIRDIQNAQSQSSDMPSREQMMKDILSTQAQPTGEDRPGEAALAGFGNAASFGYLPQLQAAAEKLTPDPSSGVDEKLKAQGFQIKQPSQDYVSLRDQNIDRLQGLQASNPKSYLAGGVAGTVASVPAVGGALGKVGLASAPASGILGRVGQAAAGGAAQGLIQNPGDTEGEVDLLQGKERLNNAALGAATGAVAQGATEGIKKSSDLILNLPNTLKEYAQLKAFKSSGAMLKDYRKAAERGRIGQMGQEMIDQGLVKAGSTFEDVAQKSSELKQKAGKVIGDTYQAASQKLENPEFLRSLSPAQLTLIEKTNLNSIEFAKELGDRFSVELKGKAGSKSALNAVQNTLEELSANGKLSNMSQIQDFKEGLDDAIKYNYELSKEPLTKQYLFKIRDYLKDKIQDRIGALDQVLGSDSLESLKEANKQYGTWAEISRISKDRVHRENANRFKSLTDTIAGVGGAGAGAVTGGLLKGDLEGTVKGAALGAGLGLLSKGSRLYGNPLLVQGASKLGSALGAIPQPATRAVSATSGLLSKNPVLLGAAAESNKGKVKKKK